MTSWSVLHPDWTPQDSANNPCTCPAPVCHNCDQPINDSESPCYCSLTACAYCGGLIRQNFPLEEPPSYPVIP